MNDEKNDTITIDFSSIKVNEFEWNSADMSAGLTTTIDTVTLSSPTVTSIGINSVSGISYDDFGPTRMEHNELLDRVGKLEKIMAEEAEIRANHPAVKNAYDEYRLLLVLAKSHLTNE